MSQPKSTNPFVYVLLGGALFLFVCCGGGIVMTGILGTNVAKELDKEIKKQEQQSKPSAAVKSAPPIVISANDLVKAYEDNAVAADEKYRYKMLQVRGTVNSVSRDVTGNPYLSLAGGNYALDAITCHFSDDQANQLAQLKKGQQVTVVGYCNGKPAFINLNDCSLK